MALVAAGLVLACLVQRVSAAGHVPVQPGSSLRFRHLRIEDGLAQGTVQAIVQDAQGYMWLTIPPILARWPTTL